MTTAPMNGHGSIWVRILIALVPLSLLGLLALGSMRSDLRHVEQAISEKASREAVDANFSALLRELQQINVRLEHIERQRP